MSFDKELLDKLIDFNEKNSPQFTLHLNDKMYPIANTVIKNSPIPVNKPTTRGGVYFSDKFAYKMKCVIEDLCVVPLLSRKMLGPNTEFGELKITTDIEFDANPVSLEIFTNLTNSVQTPSSVELGMIIVKLESV